MDILLTISYYLPLGFLVIAAAGGIAYYLLAIFCAVRLRRRRWIRRDIPPPALPPMSLLKPLCGSEPDLESCLESFFIQDYPDYEIIFAVNDDRDPAVTVVERLRRAYPGIHTTLIYTGESTYANPKVYLLEKMAEAARHPILVITDSDASVASDYLRAMAREFELPQVGAVTNLYRGLGSRDLWSKLEALGMTTEFMAGVVVAEWIEGMKFTLGPSMAIRTECLRAIGGFSKMKDYLADDFVLGNWADAAGWRVVLSTHPINHHVWTGGFIPTFRHRLRWNRSTRFSRPAGYIGQGFTYGLVWAGLLCLFSLELWSLELAFLSLTLRCWLARQLGVCVSDEQTVWRRLWLVPLQDAISFVSWLGGFSGREIAWRNARYWLLPGGRLVPLADR
ncbi:MAG TPA: bacteriohopanetetrol glucosamine biosynthesis glycosyltransferase HpnI [Blastocatellia bacterium]|nr:bacteriohopanetetrol glucosamine biosynthesis glycosyltransferase HpnI [Blastocatellia bacterium]